MNGQIQVAGDQWPVFLYANYTYDPEDPWNGPLHNGLLVSMSLSTIVQLTLWWLLSGRLSSTSSPCRVQSTKNLKQHDLGMRTFMACMLSPKLHWLMLQLRCVLPFTYIVPLILVNTGPIFAHIHSSFLSYGSCHRFWAFLQQYPRSLGQLWWEGWSWSVVDLVESVEQFEFLGILAD